MKYYKRQTKRQIKKEISDTLFITLVAIGLSFFIFLVVGYAINTIEKDECAKWVEEGKEDWAGWQKAQCKHHGFID